MLSFLFHFNTFVQLQGQSLPNEVRTEKTTTRVLGLANRLTLPPRIVDFCGTFPIYIAEEISLDSLNATFYKTQGKNIMSA